MAVSYNARDILLKVGKEKKKFCTFYSMVISFLSDVLCFVAEKNIVLSWNILRWYCKNLVDQCTRETLRFIVYFLTAQQMALSCKRVWHPWALDGGSGTLNLSCGPMYGGCNFAPCSECDSRSFNHLHNLVQSLLGRIDTTHPVHFGVSLNYECGR